MSARNRWRSRFARIEALALLLAAGTMIALGLAWWRDRARSFETPRWTPERFVAFSPGRVAPSRELWVVAVNLRCPHCRLHLRMLERQLAGRESPPDLGALVVDRATRPSPADGAALGPLSGGAWWDSAQVWREAWGRRAYGETFRFDAAGRLLSATPAGMLPDSTRSPM